MNSPDNPFFKARSPFEKNAARAISQAKPNVNSPGIISRPLPGGTSIGTPRRIPFLLGALLWHNFQPYEITTTSCKIGDGTLTVQGTTVRPFIDGVAINAATPPVLTLDPNVPNLIYIKAEMNLVTNADGYVTGGTLKTPHSSNCTIVALTAEPTSTGTVRYIPLHTISAGAVTSRTQYTNTSLQAFDDGTSTSTPVWLQW